MLTSLPRDLQGRLRSFRCQHKVTACLAWILYIAPILTVLLNSIYNQYIFKVRPHRTRSAAADCGLCPLRNVTF